MSTIVTPTATGYDVAPAPYPRSATAGGYDYATASSPHAAPPTVVAMPVRGSAVHGAAYPGPEFQMPSVMYHSHHSGAPYNHNDSPIYNNNHSPAVEITYPGSPPYDNNHSPIYNNNHSPIYNNNQSHRPEVEVENHSPTVVPPEQGFGFKLVCGCCCGCFSMRPWFIAMALSLLGVILSTTSTASCDFVKIDSHYVAAFGINRYRPTTDDTWFFENKCEFYSADEERDEMTSYGRYFALGAILLGLVCAIMTTLSCVCCCCVYPMSRRQWKFCGAGLAAVAFLQALTLILFLSEKCSENECSFGNGSICAVLAMACWIGAGAQAYFYSEENSKNTVEALRKSRSKPRSRLGSRDTATSDDDVSL